ncbi:MAG: MBL fold metallo-hydrolase [Acidimicrobiales bacterium]
MSGPGEGRFEPAASSLLEVGPGVFVRTSERFVTNTTVIKMAGSASVIIDPAVDPSDLDELAELCKLWSLDVVVGWSTHPHWDHVLWSPVLGAGIERFGTRRAARYCADNRAELAAQLQASSPGHELGSCGVLSAVELTGDGYVAWGHPELTSSPPCAVIEHCAHAPGHGALFIGELGLLVAGDMVSDVEIPLLDLSAEDPVSDYLAALDLYEALVLQLDTVVPGHGAIGDRAELVRRIAADRQYLFELSAGVTSTDPRLAAPWLAHEHERQLVLGERRWA